MEQFLGSPIKTYTYQCGIKHGTIAEEQGDRSYYHQDSFYWHLKPGKGCNSWMPLPKVDRGAIAIAMLPESQKDGKLLEHEAYFDEKPLWG
jgi:ectoine hydroxylase-related dioxygenase (phytanoyl-CoA dioxygenase family)